MEQIILKKSISLILLTLLSCNLSSIAQTPKQKCLDQQQLLATTPLTEKIQLLKDPIRITQLKILGDNQNVAVYYFVGSLFRTQGDHLSDLALAKKLEDETISSSKNEKNLTSSIVEQEVSSLLTRMCKGYSMETLGVKCREIVLYDTQGIAFVMTNIPILYDYEKTYSESEQLGFLPLKQLKTDIIELPSAKENSRFFRVVQKIRYNSKYAMFEDRLLCEEIPDLVGYVGYIIEVEE
jgi:hypothetical protein